MSVIFVGRKDSITYRIAKIKRKSDWECSRPWEQHRAGLQPTVLICRRYQAKSLTYDSFQRFFGAYPRRELVLKRLEHHQDDDKYHPNHFQQMHSLHRGVV
jgi:hypothetical protein